MSAMKAERYAAYKDSGVEWLGDVPAHWTEVRIKDLAFLERGRFTHRPRNDPEMYDGPHPFIQTGDVARANKYVTTYKQTLSDKGTEVSRKFKSGTLLMAIAANIGDVAIVNFDTYFPDSVVGFTPIKSNTDYLFYLFTATRSELDRVKVTSTQDNLNLERLNSLVKFSPPLSEQNAIAAYLDTKTAQIDRQIDLLGQKATQYGKLKQSLINETVTRGLDKSVPMKDSRVVWIGEVPEHWEIQRIGSAFEERSEKVNDTDYPPLSVSMAGIVPQMESVAKTDNNENRKRVAIGDYIINSRSDRRGASGISIYDGSVSVISIVLAPKRAFFGKYLHHLFRSYSFIEEFYRVGRGIVDDLWTTRYSVMKGIEFSYPSYEEQKKIADYLDEKTTQIDRIVTAINTQIDKLKGLRKALINDVVTGKVKVVSEGQFE
jgi:type I restriction enzyme, S subunit